MNEQLIIDALRKSRKYIRSLETKLKEHDVAYADEVREILDNWAEGDELETIDKALEEFKIFF